MNLSTNYLGLQLAHPMVMGASPLVDDLGQVRRLEDGGAAAIVMHSLFEEQLTFESAAIDHFVEAHEDSFGEATTYLPDPVNFRLGPEDYLTQVQRVKTAVGIPVIGSLNGVTDSGWLDYSVQIVEAGADALELNLFGINNDPREEASRAEDRMIASVAHVCSQVAVPVAVKLSPFYTSLSNFAARLCAAGASGLVLFNRFYQPDIDIEALDVKRTLQLSDSSELLLRTHWTAILSAQIEADIALGGGVHELTDVVKALMSGAQTVQLVSEVLQHGPTRFRELVAGLDAWLEEHEYESLDQLRGSLNAARVPDPSSYQRLNYMRLLQSFEAQF